MEVAALLNSNGVRLLRKWLPNLRKVAVVVVLVSHFTRVVDEGELPSEVGEDPLESLLRGADHACLLNDLVQVGVLLSDGIVPGCQVSRLSMSFHFIFRQNKKQRNKSNIADPSISKRSKHDI